MNENKELLEYIYKNSEMGVYSTTKLINLINGKENKIKKLIEEQLKGYEKYYKESKKLLKDNEIKNSVMTKVGASMGMKMETMKDNSDANIAHMLTQGFTMGIVDINSKIDNFKEYTDKKILNLAKEYSKFQEEQIEILKPYL